jgi:histidine ammonia-lyase
LKRIRREVPFMEKDRFLVPDLRKAEELVRTGELVQAAGEAVGTLE